VANQGCDVTTVFDAASMLAMRVVTIGDIPNRSESPHMVRVAPNNQFYCVSFIAGSKFQKFSTADNTLLGQVELGTGSWNTFSYSSDSKKAYTTDLVSGKLAIVDLDAMTAQITSAALAQPHGTALNPTDDTLYVTAQTGNFLYKIATDLSGYDIVTVNGQPQSGASSFDLHEIQFAADNSKYFVTCQKSNEVRVLSRANDALLAAIPVGTYPQEMGISKTYPYLFVSCMEDQSTFPGKRGSIFVINYNTLAVVARIYTGHQPHGIAVDDVAGRVYISNRNVSADGPAPHHSSLCGGRNGYITAIEMSSLKLVPGFKTEVSVDPYGMGITH
jgi:YVTN family beta-propeller protein